MMNYLEYMKKVGVTKRKYVERWIAQDLIPGVVKGNSFADTQFPNSARRPYCCRYLKPGLSAYKIRAHIVKACILRRHITKDICYASEEEFNGYIRDLKNAGLISERIEDGIIYYDSTLKSDTYTSPKLANIEKIVQAATATAFPALIAAIDHSAA